MASPRVGMVYGLDTIEGVIDFTFCMEVLVIVYCFHFVEWGGGSLFPQLTLHAVEIPKCSCDLLLCSHISSS